MSGKFILNYGWVTRKKLKDNPNDIYIFGDNLIEKGFGGLAKECRGEPNAFGIPTKKAPTMFPDAFFYETKEDINLVFPIYIKKYKELKSLLDEDKNVMWPEGNIGVGLAKLPSKAPTIFMMLQEIKNNLIAHSNRINIDANHSK